MKAKEKSKMPGTNKVKLTELLPELKQRGIIAQVTKFARMSIDLHSKRKNCQIRANVGSGKVGSFQKLETGRIPDRFP